MQTHLSLQSGRALDPFAPDPNAIDIVDIAHGLSHVCRFAGQSRIFYSVAQHSLLVSDSVPPTDRLWGLLHDAAEAYLGDIPTPVKRRLPDFQRVEARLLEAICLRFGLSPNMPASVAEADRTVSKKELAALGLASPETTRSIGLNLLKPDEARSRFLDRFHALSLENASIAIMPQTPSKKV